MAPFDPELLAESLTVLLYALVAAVLTAGGTLAEYSSLQQFGAGETTVALWLAGFGLVLLYAGMYKVGYQQVVCRLSRIDDQ